jgi:hypothetical protein
MSIDVMARHSHTFVEKHTGMLCFGASRQQDEATLICCLQKFSDDQVVEALIPRLNDDDRELLFNMLTGILKKHFSEDEYHSLFLKDTPFPGQ